MKERIRYEIDYRNRLYIYKGDLLLSCEYTVPPNISDKDIRINIKDILRDMGYIVRGNNIVGVKNKKSDKAEFVCGVSKGLTHKSNMFIEKWNRVRNYIILKYGVENLLYMREIDDNTFEVRIEKDSKLMCCLYKIDNIKPQDINYIEVDGYYIWII